MVLSEVAVDIVAVEDEARFRDLMQAHHYLGAVPGMGETVRYVAHHRGRWLALAVFSAPALKCGARDRWIGWDYGVQFGRLHLVTNNSRFLILPGGERNLGSRVLSLCARRLVNDWPARFGHDLLLAETFVDPAYFRGTVYRAANWIEVGRTRGFARDGHSYSEHAHPKLVFLHPLCRGARARLRAAHLDPRLRHGVPKMTLSAARMRSLPEFFQDIDDPRRRQGRRHALPTVLALATAATLCGMRGYKAISEWVRRSQPQGAAALPRAPPRRPIPPAQPLRDAQPAHPRRPGAARRRPAVVARGPWLSRQRAGHRRQDHPRRHRCRWQPSSCARHRRPRYQGILGSKKVGMRPDAGEGEKRTNEIGTVIPLLETLPDIANRTVTADALLTQRALAKYLLGRGADYLFTVKGNQPTLQDDIRLLLAETIARRAPDFMNEGAKPEHGRRERRSIWVSSGLNDYLNFPGVGQVFAIRRETREVKSGKRRCETAYGVTSLTPEAASPERLLTLNRGHWTIEATHHILDWSFDEDRSRIRTGHGPENMTRLRRFAIGLIKGRGLALAEAMRNLARNPRRVLDFLKMTDNVVPRPAPG